MEKQPTEKELRARLDDAVKRMDADAANEALEQLEKALAMAPIAAEDTALFAARIRKMQQERDLKMKKPSQISRMLLAGVAAAIVLSVGVYASGVWKTFTFMQGNRYVTVGTEDDSLTESQAKELAGDRDTYLTPSEREAAGESVYVAPAPDSFATLADAEKALEMRVALPAKLDGLTAGQVSGQALDFGSHIWAAYAGAGKYMEVSVDKTEPQDSGATVAEMEVDAGSAGNYRTKSGDVFTTLTESDEASGKTAHIAVISLGSYEYALVFDGFTEPERQAILDSVDLSIYR